MSTTPLDKVTTISDGLAVLSTAAKEAGLLMIVILANETGDDYSITGNYAPEDLPGLLQIFAENTATGNEEVKPPIITFAGTTNPALAN